MKLSDFAINSIIKEIEDRYKEAEAELKDDQGNSFKKGIYEAYFEMYDIIQSRKEL